MPTVFELDDKFSDVVKEICSRLRLGPRQNCWDWGCECWKWGETEAKAAILRPMPGRWRLRSEKYKCVKNKTARSVEPVNHTLIMFATYDN